MKGFFDNELLAPHWCESAKRIGRLHSGEAAKGAFCTLVF